MKNISAMKQDEKRSKETERRKPLDMLCSRSALLLSVVSCLPLINVELRIKEHHRLISHSVTSCDQMETEILRKLQPHNYSNWQATKESHLGGDWQEIRGITWRQLLFLSFCGAIIAYLGGESRQTSFQILKWILIKQNGNFSLYSNAR